jgi:hypothetical protein
VTNYFHYVGSGHVVWLARIYGNLWRYCQQGVEGFNNVVSLRYNKCNIHGGNKKTRQGDAKQKCPEFVASSFEIITYQYHTGILQGQTTKTEKDTENIQTTQTIEKEKNEDKNQVQRDTKATQKTKELNTSESIFRCLISSHIDSLFNLGEPVLVFRCFV